MQRKGNFQTQHRKLPTNSYVFYPQLSPENSKSSKGKKKIKLLKLNWVRPFGNFILLQGERNPCRLNETTDCLKFFFDRLQSRRSAWQTAAQLLVHFPGVKPDKVQNWLKYLSGEGGMAFFGWGQKSSSSFLRSIKSHFMSCHSLGASVYVSQMLSQSLGGMKRLTKDSSSQNHSLWPQGSSIHKCRQLEN